MTEDIRTVIESEVGKNGWRLVGKLTATMSGVILIPIVYGLINYGSLQSDVKTLGVINTAQEVKITALDDKLTARSVNQERILAELEGVKKELIKLSDVVEYLRYPVPRDLQVR